MKHPFTFLIAFVMSFLALVLAADPPAAKPVVKIRLDFSGAVWASIRRQPEVLDSLAKHPPADARR